jgi:hypothetical protein
MLAPVHMCHSNAMRGYLYGLWQPMHDRPVGHNDTFSVSGGNLNGKSFVAQLIQAWLGTSDNGMAIIETSNTWS